MKFLLIPNQNSKQPSGIHDTIDICTEWTHSDGGTGRNVYATVCIDLFHEPDTMDLYNRLLDGETVEVELRTTVSAEAEVIPA